MHRTRYIRRASGGAVAAIGVHGQGCSVHRSWFIGMRHGDFSNGCGSYVNARCKLTGKHFAGFIYREMAATWNGDDVNLQRRTMMGNITMHLQRDQPPEDAAPRTQIIFQ